MSDKGNTNQVSARILIWTPKTICIAYIKLDRFWRKLCHTFWRY